MLCGSRSEGQSHWIRLLSGIAQDVDDFRAETKTAPIVMSSIDVPVRLRVRSKSIRRLLFTQPASTSSASLLELPTNVSIPELDRAITLDDESQVPTELQAASRNQRAYLTVR